MAWFEVLFLMKARLLDFSGRDGKYGQGVEPLVLVEKGRVVVQLLVSKVWSILLLA